MSETDTLGFPHRHVAGSTGWTILALHATGGDENQLLPLVRSLAPGAAILSPRGQVLEGGTIRRFFVRSPDGTLDLEDLATRTDEVAAFVREATAHYDLDPARIVALGYSNGANVATELLLRHPGLLRGAGLLRPVLAHRPTDVGGLDGTAVLVAAGSADAYASATEIEQLATMLREAGATVDVTTAPAGHELTDGDLHAAAAWLERIQQPEPDA